MTEKPKACDNLDRKSLSKGLTYHRRQLNLIRGSWQRLKLKNRAERQGFFRTLKKRFWAHGVKVNQAQKLRERTLTNLEGCETWLVGKQAFQIKGFTNYTLGALVKGLNIQTLRKYDPRDLARKGFTNNTPYTVVRLRKDGEYEEIAKVDEDGDRTDIKRPRRTRIVGKEIFVYEPVSQKVQRESEEEDDNEGDDQDKPKKPDSESGSTAVDKKNSAEEDSDTSDADTDETDEDDSSSTKPAAAKTSTPASQSPSAPSQPTPTPNGSRGGFTSSPSISSSTSPAKPTTVPTQPTSRPASTQPAASAPATRETPSSTTKSTSTSIPTSQPTTSPSPEKAKKEAEKLVVKTSLDKVNDRLKQLNLRDDYVASVKSSGEIFLQRLNYSLSNWDVLPNLVKSRALDMSDPRISGLQEKKTNIGIYLPGHTLDPKLLQANSQEELNKALATDKKIIALAIKIFPRLKITHGAQGKANYFTFFFIKNSLTFDIAVIETTKSSTTATSKKYKTLFSGTCDLINDSYSLTNRETDAKIDYDGDDSE